MTTSTAATRNPVRRSTSYCDLRAARSSDLREIQAVLDDDV